MSVHERDVRFTPAARRDLRNIALHTRRVWGDERQARYRAALDQALAMLRGFPHVGRSRDDLFAGCRSLQVERHIVYYDELEDGTIVVLRILHQRQDASSAVRDPGS